MRILQLHSNFIEYEMMEKEVAIAEECEKKKQRLEELAVLFVSIEEGDDEDHHEQQKLHHKHPEPLGPILVDLGAPHEF